VVVAQRSFYVIKAPKGTRKWWSLQTGGRYSELVVSSSLTVQYFDKKISFYQNVFLLQAEIGDHIIFTTTRHSFFQVIWQTIWLFSAHQYLTDSCAGREQRLAILFHFNVQKESADLTTKVSLLNCFFAFVDYKGSSINYVTVLVGGICHLRCELVLDMIYEMKDICLT
jgi:hypothetical protein